MPRKETKIIPPIEGVKFDEGVKAVLANGAPGELYAKYRGSLSIGDVELKCAVLNDETRILTATSIFEAFDRSRKGINSRLEIEGTRLPPFLAAKNLEPLIDEEILKWTKPINYTDGKARKSGYDARILPKMCSLYIRAGRQGLLHPAQEKLVEKAEVLATAILHIGIVALIDEATGYQLTRKHDALRILLEQYITEGMRPWLKTFPDEFFAQLDRLYENNPTSSRKRPQYYGVFINTYVYEPIENGYVKAELDRLNITDEGKRKARFHQWLTDKGKSVLTLQIGRVMGLMEQCQNIDAFKRVIKKQKAISVAPYLFEEMNNPLD